MILLPRLRGGTDFVNGDGQTFEIKGDPVALCRRGFNATSFYDIMSA
ncbi:MAG: hypothetical protein FWE64_00450 [Alphaproteobacteria bacterium]|nr:hypothetical protein [Alphaproteobacteria bacterium]